LAYLINQSDNEFDFSQKAFTTLERFIDEHDKITKSNQFTNPYIS
jgi:hypothetical protein